MDIPLVITSDAGGRLQTASERRVSPLWPLRELKRRLEPITGIAPSQQHLALYLPRQPDKAVPLSDDEALMSSWPLEPHARIHVEDLSRRNRTAPDDGPDSSGGMEEEEMQAHVEMPIEAYEQRKDSVLAWKKAHQLGRFDPQRSALAEREKKDSQQRLQDEMDAAARNGLILGARCRVAGGRRGEIAYVGPVPSLTPGLWIGVRYDEPVGKNDGSLCETRYFTAAPRHGGFVRPDRVEVGHFPVEEIDSGSDMEEM